MSKEEDKIRNIAIVAHVDHGKTTLVDSMLKQSGTFRSNQKVESRVMDSDAIEKERGITIMAKNTAVNYNGYKINIVDTPGHADFGGEVERTLKMVDGVLLVVDAHDGPMPQTRFVLRKALALGLKACVVINKVDMDDANPKKVLDQVLDLFIDLGANEEQLEFPYVFASARDGYAFNDFAELDEDHANADLAPLFEMIIKEVPAPEGNRQGPLQLLVSNIDHDDYVGRMAVGKIERGSIKDSQQVAVSRKGEEGHRTAKVLKLTTFQGLEKVEVEEASAGDIVSVAGITDIEIGETITDPDHIEPLDFVDIDEPTISMTFSVNDSPFAGTEGTYLTSRHLLGRLEREMEKNVSMKLEETDSSDAFIVKARGELSLSVLIENMRREGYELQVSKPEVVVKEIDGKKYEPVEELEIEIPEEAVGVCMEKLAKRKAELKEMETGQTGFSKLVFSIPTRGLIGYRSEFLTDTKGLGIMNSSVEDYIPWVGKIPTREEGVLVATQTGESVAYGLHTAQKRGELFIGPNEKVYQGMIVGRTMRSDEVDVNVCRKKKQSNVRASGSDEALTLTPPTKLSLEQCLEFIAKDELVEVTPQNIRMRKQILDNEQRAKARARAKKK